MNMGPNDKRESDEKDGEEYDDGQNGPGGDNHDSGFGMPSYEPN
jgi:hypothetical protein